MAITVEIIGGPLDGAMMVVPNKSHKLRFTLSGPVLFNPTSDSDWLQEQSFYIVNLPIRRRIVIDSDGVGFKFCVIWNELKN